MGVNDPAFPYMQLDEAEPRLLRAQHLGLTKIEHFAGLAMQAMIIGSGFLNQPFNYKDVSEMAYDMAFAMLKESENRK